MIDRRELILGRLFVLLQGMIQSTPPIVATAARNRDLRSDAERPGLVLLDGDESSPVNFGTGRRGRLLKGAPQIMAMSPQVFILMNEQRPTRETIGSATNALRKRIVDAVFADDQLALLYGENGSIVLESVVTDMKSGGAISGSMMLNFRITYPLLIDSSIDAS